MRKRLSVACISVLVSCLAYVTGAQQRISSLDLDRSRGMLRDVHDAVKKHYYDATYHGLDMDARYREYDEKLKQSTSLGQAFTIIAAYLELLHDSHTFFIPPRRTTRFDYGYRMEVVGETAYVTDVRPNTDAAMKLHPGDEIDKVFGYNVNRKDIWQLQYFLNMLSPRPALVLDVLSPDGKQSQVTVNAKTRQLQRVLDLTGSSGDMDIWQLIREGESEDHLLRQRYVEMGDLTIWKMPEFDMDEEETSRMFGIVRKRESLILDLRGNPGGNVETLEQVVGYLFDRDIKIADRIGRKELKPQLAKTRGKTAFTGKLVVLIDSRSASAAELLARVVELEKRGTVVGDRSSGSVMESRIYPFKQGADSQIYYDVAVTDADLTMSDGKSLEHEGVSPDDPVLPSGDDLSKSKDPALAYAAKLLGVNLDPGAAGKLFPIEWSPY